jgi:hypothetical protein
MPPRFAALDISLFQRATMKYCSSESHGAQELFGILQHSEIHGLTCLSSFLQAHGLPSEYIDLSKTVVLMEKDNIFILEKYAKKQTIVFTVLLALACLTTSSAMADSESRRASFKAALAHEMHEVDQALSASENNDVPDLSTWRTKLDTIKSSMTGQYDVHDVNPEIHVVAKCPLGWHVPSNEVELTYTGAPIILALGGWVVDWKLKLKPGVSLTKIVILGKNTPVKGLPPSVPIQRIDDIYIGEMTPDDTVNEKLKSATGCATATSLRDFGRSIVGPENPDWRTQHLLYRLTGLYKEVRSQI